MALLLTAARAASPGPRNLARRSVILGAPFVPAALLAAPRAARAAERTGPPLSVLITGGNSGIGFEAARKLVGEGHSVTLACRTQARADAAAAAVNAEAGASRGVARGVECDLASLASVRRCAAEQLSGVALDVLVLNAAVAPGTQETAPKRTADGFEETIGVNHLGHFLLTSLLLPGLKARPGRPAPR
jgi:protochlorophyllide reductase